MAAAEVAEVAEVAEAEVGAGAGAARAEDVTLVAALDPRIKAELLGILRGIAVAHVEDDSVEDDSVEILADGFVKLQAWLDSNFPTPEDGSPRDLRELLAAYRDDDQVSGLVEGLKDFEIFPEFLVALGLSGAVEDSTVTPGSKDSLWGKFFKAAHAAFNCSSRSSSYDSSYQSAWLAFLAIYVHYVSSEVDISSKNDVLAWKNWQKKIGKSSKLYQCNFTSACSVLVGAFCEINETNDVSGAVFNVGSRRLAEFS